MFSKKLNKNFPIKKLKVDFFQKQLLWFKLKNSNNRHTLTIFVKQSLRWQVIWFPRYKLIPCRAQIPDHRFVPSTRSARLGACARQRINLYLEIYILIYIYILLSRTSLVKIFPWKFMKIGLKTLGFFWKSLQFLWIYRAFQTYQRKSKSSLNYKIQHLSENILFSKHFS